MDTKDLKGSNYTMQKSVCSRGGMLDELLKWPVDLLVLRGSDGEQGDPDDEDDEDDKDDKGGDNGDEPKVPTAEEWDAAQKSLSNFEEERNRIQKRRRDAEKARDGLQAEIDELKRNGANDDAIKERISGLETENESLKSRISSQAMELAFFKSNKHEWQNPAGALKLIDLSEVEVSSDGEVDGMSAALDKLAQEHAYLLKPKDDGKKKPPSQKSGETPKQRGDNDSRSQAAQEAKLRQKYPALRRR